MKKYALWYLILTLFLAACASQPTARATTTVLMIPREGSASLQIAIEKEANVMIAMLKNAGYTVVVATASGKPLTTESMSLVPDMKIAEAVPTDYVGIIMPCMNAGDAVAPAAVDFVKKAAAATIPIAAMRGSCYILNTAGLRDYTNDPQLAKDPEGMMGGSTVIRIGDIITAGVCPYYAMETHMEDLTVKLTEAFIALLREKGPAAL